MDVKQNEDIDQAAQSQQDIVWMNHAIKLARKAATLGEVPVGAVVVYEGRVIGEGWNQPISSHDATAHAEVVAIRAANLKQKNYRIPETTLYITIEPCAMCLGAIIHSRIGRVVFGAPEPKAGMLKSHSELLKASIFNHAFTFSGGVCEQECAQLISDFFRERRTIKKSKIINTLDNKDT